jgi:hypothetical protein
MNPLKILMWLIIAAVGYNAVAFTATLEGRMTSLIIRNMKQCGQITVCRVECGSGYRDAKGQCVPSKDLANKCGGLSKGCVPSN